MGVYDLSKTAANNLNVEGISRAEGMGPANVNNAMRADLAMLAEWRDDVGGQLVTTGASNVYAVTTNATVPALADGVRFIAVANHSSTGAATLNVDLLGAKAIRKVTLASTNDIAIVADDIRANHPCDFVYDASANSAAGAWILLNPLSGRDFTAGTGIDLTGNAIALTGAYIASIAEIPDKVSKTASGTETMVASLALPHVLETYRGLNIREVLNTTDHTVDQNALVQPMIQSWISSVRYADLDLDGVHVGISGAMAFTGDVATSRPKRMHNGGFWEVTDQPTVTALTEAGISLTANSTSITVVGAASLQVGDWIDSSTDGIPLENYVTAINGTTVTMWKPAYRTASRTLTFKRFIYLLDFIAMTNFPSMIMESMTFLTHSRISTIRTDTTAGRQVFRDCFFDEPKERGVTCIEGSSFVFESVRASSGEASTSPHLRTKVFANLGGDAKVKNCNVTMFKHAFVSNGNVTYMGNHNFQGASEFVSRTAQLVMQGKTFKAVVSDNYMDNGGVLVTDEGNTTGSVGVGLIIYTNNKHTHGGVITADYAPLTLQTVNTDQAISEVIVKDNIYTDFDGPNRLIHLDESKGTFDRSLITQMLIESNIQNGFNFITSTRPTRSITVAEADAAQNWDIHFTQDGTEENVRSNTAQAGANPTITLAAGASAVDDFYNDLDIEIITGPGVGESQTIQDYVGATKVASFDYPWTTTPTSASDYAIDVSDSGTAQAGGASTITLRTGASAADDFYNGDLIQITSGTGSGQRRTISDYVGSTKVATLSSAWGTQPDATSVYVVAPYINDVASATNATITLDAGASAANDAYNGMSVRITGGTGDAQVRVITDYVGATKVATVKSNWTTIPDSSSAFRVGSAPLFPFALTIKRVLKVTIRDLRDGTGPPGAAQYDEPRVLLDGDVDGPTGNFIVRLRFSAARAGTAIVQADCSLNDIDT